jgi:hypothetical protein
MSPASERIQKALRQHGAQLAKALRSADRYESGIHGLVAVQLRVLLCDADCPLIPTYADTKMVNIYVYGPIQQSTRLRKSMVVHVNERVISHRPFAGSQPYDLQTYLDATIQVVPVRSFQDECPGEEVTPRKLIKWVANKDGYAHFDFNVPRAFQSLKSWHRADSLGVTEEFAIKDNIFQIADWAGRMIDLLLLARPGNKLV